MPEHYTIDGIHLNAAGDAVLGTERSRRVSTRRYANLLEPSQKLLVIHPE
jgi:hypothetical protein